MLNTFLAVVFICYILLTISLIKQDICVGACANAKSDITLCVGACANAKSDITLWILLIIPWEIIGVNEICRILSYDVSKKPAAANKAKQSKHAGKPQLVLDCFVTSFLATAGYIILQTWSKLENTAFVPIIKTYS